MAMKKGRQLDFSNAPQNLDHHPFFGLQLDEDQLQFANAIWSSNNDIIFVDAVAGSGKTTVAVSTAVLLCKYGLYDDIVYVMHPISDSQGYLPGTITEKSSVYFEALYQALITANEMPEQAIRNTSMAYDKQGLAFVTAITDSYLRGSNIGGNSKTVLIVDEAQNFDTFSLRKVLTRACENTKVIVIGHDLQCDLRCKHESGFKHCMEHFRSKNHPRFAFCELKTCHRSLVAQVADEPWDDAGNPVKAPYTVSTVLL